MEDRECCRFRRPEDERKQKKEVNKELIKLVPESFKISILPAFFNHTDADRIGMVVKDNSQRFLEEPPKKVKFSVAVKIFPYNSNVSSVRLVIAKMMPCVVDEVDGEQGEDDGPLDIPKSKKKSKE